MTARSIACLLLLAGTGMRLACSSYIEKEASAAGGDACGDEEASLAQLRVHGSFKPPSGCTGQAELEVSLFQGKDPGAVAPFRFVSNSPEFDKLIAGAKVVTLAEKNYAFAHESPVYLKDHDWVSFSSDRLACGNMRLPGECWPIKGDGQGDKQFIEASYIDLKSGKVTTLERKVWNEEITMINGGFPIDGESVYLTSQGIRDKKAGVYSLNVRTGETRPVITTSSFMEAPFNSPNDVVKDPITGALLFTDPIYGWEQGFRSTPMLGNWLWMYPMANGSKEERPHDLRMVADTFDRPNGVAFASERGDVLYVTDTGYFPGNDNISPLLVNELIRNGTYTMDAAGKATSNIDPLGPRTIYAFDVLRDKKQNIYGLSGKRVVNMADVGIPDGIKVDCAGRIYAGQDNGVGIFSADGVRLGNIEGPKTGNLVLVPRGCRTQVVMMGEDRIFSVFLNTKTCIVSR